jgi:hypothetical protein
MPTTECSVDNNIYNDDKKVRISGSNECRLLLSRSRERRKRNTNATQFLANCS